MNYVDEHVWEEMREKGLFQQLDFSLFCFALFCKEWVDISMREEN